MSSKKIVRLKESDLIKLIKRVISEQTEKGPIIPEKYKSYKFQLPKNEFKLPEGTMSSDDFLESLKNSPIGMNAFHIKSDGWEFPIYPVYANLGNFRVSFEPLDERKTMMVKWKKNF